MLRKRVDSDDMEVLMAAVADLVASAGEAAGVPEWRVRLEVVVGPSGRGDAVLSAAALAERLGATAVSGRLLPDGREAVLLSRRRGRVRLEVVGARPSGLPRVAGATVYELDRGEVL